MVIYLLKFEIKNTFGGEEHSTRGILVPQPGIKPVPPPLAAWSLNHQTAREFSNHYLLKKIGSVSARPPPLRAPAKPALRPSSPHHDHLPGPH